MAVVGWRRTWAGLSALFHASILPFNLVGGAIEGMRKAVSRLKTATGPLRTVVGGAFSAITFPIRLATRHLGIFDSRVSLTTNALRLMGRTASAITSPLVMPFKLAIMPIQGMISLVRGLIGHLQMIAPMMAAAFVGQGIRLATSLNETVNRVRVTFRDAAGSVTAMADDMASRFGVVRNQGLEAAAQIGAIAHASGLSETASAGLSTEMTRLAADLSSFMNLSFDEALAKIRSGLVGQSEPLRDVGVLLSADAVEARGLAMGLADTNGELSEGAKVQARAALITEQLADAHGDLARTANSPANLFRELKGRIQNAAAAIGQALLPAWRELLLLLNDLMVGSTDLGTSVVDVATRIGAAIQSAIHFIRQMWAEWDSGVALVGLALKQAGEYVRYFVDFGRSVFAAFFGWLGDNWRVLLASIGEWVQVMIGQMINGLVDAFASMASRLQQYLTDLWNWMSGGFEGAAPALVKSIESSGTGAGNGQMTALELPEFKLPDTFVPEIKSLAEKIATAALRGDGGDGAPGVPKPADMIAAQDQAAAKEQRSRVGEMLGARELLGLMQGSANEKNKDSKNIEATARAATRQVEILEDVRGNLAGGAVMA